MKIAIFGGAFNPVHNEHVNIVKAAIDSLNLNKVIIVPTHISPHKSGKLPASSAHRLNMCRLAFKDIAEAEVSDYELKSNGVSYSYITCEHFKALYPNDEIIFIVGADMLEYFPKWKHPERILSCVTLAACARESCVEFENIKNGFYATFKRSLLSFGYVGKKVSSTDIRVLAALGEDISPFVSASVDNYISQSGVYLQKNLIKVKGFLNEERWQHTVRVAQFAVKNASKIGADELTVLTAATLHDCAKYVDFNSEILKNFVPPKGVPKPVMHQFSGAYMAANYFKIQNVDILNAIKYHTSARQNMSPLEKLIYLSDMLEEGRSFPQAGYLRKLFEKDITECLKAALGHQIKYLKATGDPVYELTQKAYDYLIGE